MTWGNGDLRVAGGDTMAQPPWRTVLPPRDPAQACLGACVQRQEPARVSTTEAAAHRGAGSSPRAALSSSFGQDGTQKVVFVTLIERLFNWKFWSSAFALREEALESAGVLITD